MHGYIYKTTNLINGKVYVGKREQKFNPRYLGSGILLHKALDKYGKNNFKLEVIVHTENKEQLRELEKKYIADYREICGKRNVYNIAEGGAGGNTGNHADVNGTNNPFYKKHHTEASKLANRLAHLNKHPSIETRIKMSRNSAHLCGEKNPRWGKHISESHRLAISGPKVERETRLCGCGCGYSKVLRVTQLWGYKRGHNPKKKK
jgi:group I intron endonuclease